MSAAPPPSCVPACSASLTAARRLDPVSLRLFRAAVEERNLAWAAEREGIALSAASRRIAEMEARLGAQTGRAIDELNFGC